MWGLRWHFLMSLGVSMEFRISAPPPHGADVLTGNTALAGRILHMLGAGVCGLDCCLGGASVKGRAS